MNKVRKTYHNEKEVLVVDYSDCRGDEMIEVFDEAKDLILSENKHFVLLNIFNNRSYVSPNFMRHVESESGKVEILIHKQAVVGMSTTQDWIRKGVNLWYTPQINKFDSIDEALSFLTEN